MELFKMKDGSVRAVITKRDLEKMKLGGINHGTPDFGILMRKIIEAVCAESGFSADGGRILAEVVFAEGRMILTLSQMPGRIYREPVIFRMDCFDALCGLLSNINGKYLRRMRLYEYRGKYFLAVPRGSVPAILYEYSVRVGKSNIIEGILSEHGKMIADGDKLYVMGKELKDCNK